MKLVLKDKKVVPEDVIIQPDDVVKIEAGTNVLNYNFSIQFNGGEWHKLKGLETTIPKKAFDRDKVDIRIAKKDSSTGEGITYEGKDIPISVIHVIGECPTKLYPKAIYELHHRIKKLEEQIEKIQSEGDIL